MPLNTSCLYSTVRNASGGVMNFGFLPPHGKTLAASEEYTVFGDITAALYRFERTEGRRNVIAFERALQRGDIEIVSTPAPILEDTVALTSKMLKLTSGSLGVADPCWTVSVSDPPIG